MVHRRLTSRQQSLILSYAEDETDVEGTVNGVTQTSAGKGLGVSWLHSGAYNTLERWTVWSSVFLLGGLNKGLKVLLKEWN